MLNDPPEAQGKSLRQVEVPGSGDCQDIGHARIVFDFDLAVSAENIFSRCYLAHRGFLIQTRINCGDTDRRKAAAMYASAIAADHVIGVKVSERNRAEEISFERPGVRDQHIQLSESSPADLQTGSPA